MSLSSRTEYTVVLTLAIAILNVAAAHLIDPRAATVPFAGFGALSGGGATSKLLPSYSSTQRGEILDLLFKPKGLASLQILKVEIGGDTCSTEGSELSHMHTAEDLDCTRGYEWWLMKEAVARNPSIQLYGLPWGFPHFLGGSDGNALANANATAKYVVQWVKCAATHGLNISWIGPWNEKDTQFANAGSSYIKTLRKELDSSGFASTKIIAGDVHSWAPASEMLVDPTLMSMVDALGMHYPNTQSDTDAKRTGKPLWSSEDYAASNAGSGGRCLARILNQNWVNGAISGTVAWNLISAYYEWLSWSDDGLMTARSPWSGHYTVQPPMYAAAHTTQFAEPGWMLAAVGNGSGKLTQGGSYVTYFNGEAFSVVIEKVQANQSSCGFQATPSYRTSGEVLHFNLAEPFRGKVRALSHWRSSFANGTFFIRHTDIAVAMDGSFSISVQIDDLISLTTTSGQNDGAAGLYPPADGPFPISHIDDFEGHALGQEADYFAQMTGAFEVARMSGNPKKQVLRQAAVGFPVKWLRNDVRPFTQIGDSRWADTNVSCRLLVEDAGEAGFIGVRAQLSGTDGSGSLFGIIAGLGVSTGMWFLAGSIKDVASPGKWVASGPAEIHTHTWYMLQLKAKGSTVAAWLNGDRVASVRTPTSTGNAALGTTNYTGVQFDDFVVSATPVSPAPAPAPGPPPLPAPPVPTGCKDPAAAQALHMYGCGPDVERRTWTLHPNGTIEMGNTGLCMSYSAGSCSGGQCVVLSSCSAAPVFNVMADGGTFGTITTKIGAEVHCLDWDATGSTLHPEAHPIDIYKCNSRFREGLNQQWAYDQATGALSSALFASETSCLAVCDADSGVGSGWIV